MERCQCQFMSQTVTVTTLIAVAPLGVDMEELPSMDHFLLSRIAETGNTYARVIGLLGTWITHAELTRKWEVEARLQHWQRHASTMNEWLNFVCQPCF
jgi:hypothetical protein